MKSTKITVFAVACAFVLGCGDDSKIDLPEQSSSNGIDGTPNGNGGSQSDAGPRTVVCDGAPDGTPCGSPSDRTHCIFDACVRNACGDGVPAFGEECDDGDEEDGDGCSSRCKLEVKPGCGNGVLEPGEQCDDGNMSDADACTAACKNPRCGDGVVSRGEECDDGNVSNGDACTSKCEKPPVLCGNNAMDPGEECDDGNTTDGDGCQGDCTLPKCGDGHVDGDEQCDDGNTTAGDGCENDCTLPVFGTGGTGSGGNGSGGTGSGGTGSGGTGSGGTGSGGTGGNDEDAGTVTDSDCEACRETNCTNYQGYMNPVDGCFDTGADGMTARMVFGSTAAAFSPTYVQTCVDAIACARANGCGHTLGTIASDCYCGPFHSGFGLDECGTKGPEGTPPCRAAWEALTGQTIPSMVLNTISDAENSMAGYAYNLLECDAYFCTGDTGQIGNCLQ